MTFTRKKNSWVSIKGSPSSNKARGIYLKKKIFSSFSKNDNFSPNYSEENCPLCSIFIFINRHTFHQKIFNGLVMKISQGNPMGLLYCQCLFKNMQFLNEKSAKIFRIRKVIIYLIFPIGQKGKLPPAYVIV